MWPWEPNSRLRASPVICSKWERFAHLSLITVTVILMRQSSSAHRSDDSRVFLSSVKNLFTSINAAVIIHSQIIHSQYFRNNELKKINDWTAIVRKVRSLIIGSVRSRKKKAIKQCKSKHIPQSGSVPVFGLIAEKLQITPLGGRIENTIKRRGWCMMFPLAAGSDKELISNERSTWQRQFCCFNEHCR